MAGMHDDDAAALTAAVRERDTDTAERLLAAGAPPDEEIHGIRVPYDELADRALAFAPGHAGRFAAAAALADRVDDETFAVAARQLATAPDAGRRRFAAEVLLVYGLYAEGVEDADRLEKAAGEVLLRRAAVEQDPGVLTEIICGLGLHHEPRAVPAILRHAGHPEPDVRAQVAAALTGMVAPDDTEALGTLLALVEDRDPQVRRCAAATLADLPADPPAVRAALAGLLADPDPDVAVEGARGLGLRDDPRGDTVLVRAFDSRPPDSTPEVHRTYEAIRRMPLARFLAARAALAALDTPDT